MRERDIEAYLVKACKRIGALCDKFTSPSQRSVPDRIITSYGAVYFIEVKAPGKEPTLAQYRDHARRRALGANVGYVNSMEAVDTFIDIARKGRPLNEIGTYAI